MMKHRTTMFTLAMASGALFWGCGDDNGGNNLGPGQPDASNVTDGGGLDAGGHDGGANDGGVPCDITPTFTSIYGTILGSGTCNVGGCHAPAVQGGFDVSAGKAMTYSALVGANVVCQSPCSPTVKTAFPKRVVASNSAMSFLYSKLSSDSPGGGNGGSRMPLGGRLMDCEIQVIKQWIDMGAMNN